MVEEIGEIRKKIYNILQKDGKLTTKEISEKLKERKSELENSNKLFLDTDQVFSRLVNYSKVKTENDHVDEMRPRDIEAIKDVTWSLDESQMPGSH